MLILTLKVKVADPLGATALLVLPQLMDVPLLAKLLVVKPDVMPVEVHCTVGWIDARVVFGGIESLIDRLATGDEP